MINPIIKNKVNTLTDLGIDRNFAYLIAVNTYYFEKILDELKKKNGENEKNDSQENDSK